MLQKRHGNVVNGYASFRAPLWAAAVSVTVENSCHWIAVQRLLKPAGSQKRKDFWRLTFNRGLDRRVVEQGDALRRAQLR